METNELISAIEEAKEQERKERERKAEKIKKMEEENFKRELINGLRDVLDKDASERAETQKVQIPLNEYIELVCMVRDLDTLKGAMLESLELDYSGEGLRVAGDAAINAFKVLFTAEYKHKLAKLKGGE